jgi:hypothetical protein
LLKIEHVLAQIPMGILGYGRQHYFMSCEEVTKEELFTIQQTQNKPLKFKLIKKSCIKFKDNMLDVLGARTC